MTEDTIFVKHWSTQNIEFMAHFFIDRDPLNDIKVRVFYDFLLQD